MQSNLATPTKNVITKVIAGEDMHCLYAQRKLNNRLRWILNSAAKGRFTIDSGAAEAVKKINRSAKGLKAVTGNCAPAIDNRTKQPKRS
jgi:glutamate 5-kinase